MCLFCPSFTDYANSRRSNFDPKRVQKRLEIHFRTRPKKWSRGGPKVVPEWWFLVPNQNHIVPTRTCLSAKIMIVCKDHHPLPRS